MGFSIPGLGQIAEAVCDAVGLPEKVGDAVGLGVDLNTGNWLGALEHGQDMLEADGGAKKAGRSEGGISEIVNKFLGKTESNWTAPAKDDGYAWDERGFWSRG